MVKLVRTRQADFQLGENVIEWEDLNSPDAAIWEGKVVKTLRAWSDKHYGGGKQHGAASRSINSSISPKEEGQIAAKDEIPTKEGDTAKVKIPTKEVEPVNTTVADAYFPL